MRAVRQKLLDSLKKTLQACEEEVKKRGAQRGFCLLGVQPHWALSFFEHNKNVENKTTTWPFGAELRWIGIVASSGRPRWQELNEIARIAKVPLPEERREYTCKNHLIGLVLMGPPTVASRTSSWAISTRMVNGVLKVCEQW